jgi:hypothetical protein
LSIRGVSEVEREVVMSYLVSRWKRSELIAFPGAPAVSDPGHDKDEICPILYYGQPFDPSNEADVAALSDYSVRELRGWGYYTLAVSSGTWSGEQLPLNLVDVQWVLESPTGSVNVSPRSPVAPGQTVTFDVEGGGSFTAAVQASYLHGVGFLVVNLAELQSVGLDAGSRGGQLTRVGIRLMYAVAPPSAPAVADAYAAAANAMLRGVMWVSEPQAVSGLTRDMADSGITIIRQLQRQDPPQERPNRLSESNGWVWFTSQVVIRRQTRLPVAGRQNPT